MAFTRNWNEASPDGDDQANTIDDSMRNLKVDVSDRIKNMIYGFIAGENTLSQHFQYLQFYEQASVSQPAAGYGRVYCKAVSGKCELFWQDEDGDEIQLTTGGKWNGAVLSNDSVDSQHYAAGSIDLEHLAADCVDGTKIADDAIDSEHIVDGSVDPVHIANLDPDSYGGEESVTFPNGLIMKFGAKTGVSTTAVDVTFATAFPNGVISAGTTNNLASPPDPTAITTLSTSKITLDRDGAAGAMTVYWWVVGY